MHDTTMINAPVPFLATTAAEAFWDTSKPMVFLGEWCRRYSRQAFWEPLGGEVLANPWLDPQERHEAHYYVSTVYERLLPALGEALNATHKINHGARYWRILLGPWLQLYIPVVYDRYVCLQKALAKYPNLTSIVLSADTAITPTDFDEFFRLTQEDLYNLQIYSHIFRFLGKNFPDKKAELVVSDFDTFKTDRSFSGTAIDLLKKAAIIISRTFKSGHPIIFRDSIFSPSVELQLILKTTGNVWPIHGESPRVQGLKVLSSLRENLSGLLAQTNNFEALLNTVVPLDIPMCCIEGYGDIAHMADKMYPAKPKAIFSASAFHYDEIFKQWAATSAEKGTLLLFTQHGGNYGSCAYLLAEDHEIAIADRYYTWGWDRPDAPRKVLPSSATKLSGRKLLMADNQKEGILFVATTFYSYLIEFSNPPIWLNHYLSCQSRFLSILNPSLLPQLRIRLRRFDYGLEMYQRWKDIHPDITVEIGGHADFFRSLDNCRLYVCDQLSTTYLEALSSNKPAILFWDPAMYELRPEAQPYYDHLRRAGILHDSAEAAAEAVNIAYPDVEKWWNDPNRQAARRTFCNRFAKTSSNAVDEWAQEFNRIAAQSKAENLTM